MRLAIAALAVLLAGLPARAAEDPPAGAAAPTPAAPDARPAPEGKRGAAPSPAAQGLARVLLTDNEWNGLLDRYARSLSGQISQTLAASGEPVPDDLAGTIRKHLGDRMPYGETMIRHAQALADRFTPGELKKATDFYSSKVGNKLLHALPETQAEVGEFLQDRLASVVPDIVKQVAPKALEPPKGRGEPAEPGKRPPQARTPPDSPGAKP